MENEELKREIEEMANQLEKEDLEFTICIMKKLLQTKKDQENFLVFLFC